MTRIPNPQSSSLQWICRMTWGWLDDLSFVHLGISWVRRSLCLMIRSIHQSPSKIEIGNEGFLTILCDAFAKGQLACLSGESLKCVEKNLVCHTGVILTRAINVLRMTNIEVQLLATRFPNTTSTVLYAFKLMQRETSSTECTLSWHATLTWPWILNVLLVVKVPLPKIFTWNLKMMISRYSIGISLSRGSLFRFHVSF